MQLQRLYSLVRKAMEDYSMIQPGDKIALGVSGGKDSLTLLYALAGLRRFYPVPFELAALTVDLGYGDFDLTETERLCSELQVPFCRIETRIGEMVSEGQCSLCARLRKGALAEKAGELGCTGIAYAHNQDDVVETMLMSLIFEGRFSSFWPVTVFEDTNLKVIRPLIYVPAADVTGFRNRYALPVKKNPCPYDSTTKRTYVREILKGLERDHPGVRSRMMTAVENSPDWRRIAEERKGSWTIF